MGQASRALVRNSFPTFSDSFNRADGTPLTVTDTGQTWKGTTGSFPFDVQSGGGRCTLATSTRAAYFDCATDVKVRIKFKNMGNSTQGPIVRASSNTRFYRAEVGGNVVRIVLRTDSGSTTLATSSTITPPVDTDEFYFSVDGDYLEAGINGVKLVGTDDDSWSSDIGVGWFVVTSNTILCDSIVAEPLKPKPIADFSFAANFAANGLSDYWSVVHPETASVVDDPVLGSARKVLKLTVPDTAIGPTDNPRCQLTPRRQLLADTEFYVGVAHLFPSVGFISTMPTAASGFLNTCQIFGPPFTGSSPMHLGFRANGTRQLLWLRNADYGDVPWSTPGDVVYDQWYDFVFRVKMSNDPTVGFIEMWQNIGSGWQQQSLNGQTRLYMKTQSMGVGAVIEEATVDIQMYRKVGLFDTVTMYHGHHAIGHSFNEVAPHSYG